MKVFIILLFIFLCSPIFSVTVLMKNGSNKKGKVEVGVDKVKIFLLDGSVETVNKKAILKILFEDLSDSEIAKIRKTEEDKLKEQLEKTLKLNRDMEQKIKDMETRMKELQGNQEAMKELLAEMEVLRRKLKENEIKTMWGTVGRAAAFSGLGHFYLERKYFGWAYSSIFVTSAVMTFKSYGDYLASRRRVEQATFSGFTIANFLGLFPSPESQLINLIDIQEAQSRSEELKSNTKTFNNSLTIMLGTYFIQLYHAYVLGKAVEYGDILLPSEEEKTDANKVSFYWNYRPEFSPILNGNTESQNGWKFDAYLQIKF